MVFIVNVGCPSYLKYVVSQIAMTNGKEAVTLVMEKTYSEMNEFKTILMSDYSILANEFASYYKSLFQKEENHSYELIWFQRFMFVLEYLETIGHKRDFWIVDSDVMIYSNLNDIVHSPGKTFTINEDEDPCFMWFKDSAILREFCEFILQYYRNSFSEIESYYIKNYIYGNLKGGICEMTFLKWFAAKKSEACQDLTVPINGWAFDRGLHKDDGYKRNLLDGKKIYWNKNQPYGKCGGEEVHFHGLHCQGNYKKLIPCYYAGKASGIDWRRGLWWLAKSYARSAPKNILKMILGMW